MPILCSGHRIIKVGAYIKTADEEPRHYYRLASSLNVGLYLRFTSFKIVAKMSNFTYSQKGKRLLTLDGYVYQQNRKYSSKSGDTVVYWQCERKRDLKCATSVKTDVATAGPTAQTTATTIPTSSASSNHYCPVCLTNLCDTAIVPCGHCVCIHCMNSITSSGTAAAAVVIITCPVCRSVVSNFFKLHFAGQ